MATARKVESLRDVLSEEIRDLYSAEAQIMKALPKMAKKAHSEELKEAFTMHAEETERQIQRLEQVAEKLEIKLSGKTCEGMKGLLKEGEEMMKKEGNPFLIDSLMIGAAQRVEHYEISAYGTARTLAETLGEERIVELLQETLDEESATDEKLTAISEEEILPQVSHNGVKGASAEGEEGEDIEGEFLEEGDEEPSRPHSSR